eukprot:4507570-Pyramimonas_sp.AAC.1
MENAPQPPRCWWYLRSARGRLNLAWAARFRAETWQTRKRLSCAWHSWISFRVKSNSSDSQRIAEKPGDHGDGLQGSLRRAGDP